VEGKPSHVTVQGRVRLRAEAQEVFDLLTRYEDSEKVFSNIAATTVKVQESGAKHLLQSCNWNFLGLSGQFDAELAVAEYPADRSLVFSLLQTGFMREMEGRWVVKQPTDSPNECEVEHTLSVQPAVMPPRVMHGYVHNIFVKQVTGILEDLEKEVHRRHQGPHPDSMLQ
jgi:ribosome-associated toxin RatA of RatAB toxin-antitoxin module